MYLKSLTLSGFKSFGKTTVFEFPSRITAVVGPNGSGKSNVAEAVRWVLGEQSMKSLRGKRGEDLIYSGSDKTARLGRAEVKLVFDNSSKQFPFEFDDVIISRRVHRDGANEYLLNGSAVRLKDIFGLLAKVGLGSTQHHIISQGEVDRILWASPRERQEMIEEALGLKEFHLKARDAERKLDETSANVEKVEAMRREIRPHLKYLRIQADKMKASEKHSIELERLLADYTERERATLSDMRKKYGDMRSPLAEKQAKLKDKIAALQKTIYSEEQEFLKVRKTGGIRDELDKFDEKRRALERELGRVEGLLSTGGTSHKADVPAGVLLREIRGAVALVDELLGKDSFEALKSGLKDVKVSLEGVVKIISGGGVSGMDAKLAEKKGMIAGKIAEIERQVQELRGKQREDETIRDDIMADLRAREQQIREEERALEEINAKLREIEFSEQSYKTREVEFKEFLRGRKLEPNESVSACAFKTENERHALLRNIERLKIKLEEAGGIDASVISEYEDTVRRDEFLAGELGDLENARKALENLMKELEGKLEERFTTGLKKINEEFHERFRKIFGGGKASLVYKKPVKAEEGEDSGSGIDIFVDLPRKRIRSLDMLSGGERALTSVALLFAVSAVNPPPFLVLDETDAALDEANSQRYGELLEGLGERTQLLVITHNRETMRRAGVLYGVTMGSDGVSKILSLKFEEASELAGVDE